MLLTNTFALFRAVMSECKYFTTLCFEGLVQVVDYLDIDDVLRCCLVSRIFHAAAAQNLIFYKFVRQRLLIPPLETAVTGACRRLQL